MRNEKPPQSPTTQIVDKKETQHGSFRHAGHQDAIAARPV
jgi:hypothetical protein